MALLGDREWESQMAVDTYEKQSSIEGDVNAAVGDQKWESQMAVDTYEKRSSLEGDVNGAARGSRVGESDGRGHI